MASSQQKRTELPMVSLLLALFILTMGGGAAYLYMTKAPPSWMSFFIPASRYAPLKEESAVTEEHAPPRWSADSGTPAPSFPPEAATPASRPAPPLPGDAANGALTGPGSFALAAEEQSPSGERERQAEHSGEPTQPDTPGSALPDAQQPANQAGSSPVDEGHAEKPSSQPVIVYGKGKPTNSASSAVRGSISTQRLSAKSRRGDETTLSAVSVSEDSVVTLAFVEDMAGFLASNFWPAGTHPLARERAISTAGIKWANIKYGARLQGFAVNRADPVNERARVLQYVFVPSMIHGIYNLYSRRFLEFLDREARAQVRGRDAAPLTDAQIADMYELYAGEARNLAEAIRAYMRAPDTGGLVAAYSKASMDADRAYKQFTASLEEHESDKNLEAARGYQEAIMQREQRREELAAALRRNGATREMDADSLVYAAQWLYRRGTGKEQAFSALASVLDSCAGKLTSLGSQYRALRQGPQAATSRTGP